MSTRRYDEAEAREIFRLATASSLESPPPTRESLTLVELQAIGTSVGIDPGDVAHAAERLDVLARVGPVRRSLGMRISIEHVTRLPRTVTDGDWARLVSECRTVFGAHGHLETSGPLRDWAHGGLHVSIEPTADGSLLRLRDVNSVAETLNAASVAAAAVGVLLSVVIALTGQPVKSLVAASVFGSIALILHVTNRLRLSRWARDRHNQLSDVGDRALRILTIPPVSPSVDG